MARFLLLSAAILIAGCASAPQSSAPARAPLEPIAWPDDSRALELQVLNRVSWGANSSSAADIARLGTGRWLDSQLRPARAPLPAEMQARIDAMTISQRPIADIAADLERQRRAFQSAPPEERKAERQAFQQELTRLGREAQARMLLRALYSPNQLEEHMTWFWMNHFSVFQFKGPLRGLLADYEERAIRPQALGRFRDLLGATARHPAMLIYLDNARNSAGRINENYARELMELHTLGVEGGYTQKDVQEVARAFTGWTIFAPRGGGVYGDEGATGRAGTFLFNPRMHDEGEKVVLGQKIPGGGGMEDGEKVLDILVAHPSTAKFVATKLCRFFVSDTPDPALVSRVADAFHKSNGDIKTTLRAIFYSPEFNSPEARRAKIKTPFELAVSAIRTLGAETDARPALAQWIAKMGEQLYGYQAPTGYPDTADYWVNTGALLERLNFSLALVSNRIPGTRVDLSRFVGDEATSSRAVDQQRIVERFLDVALQGDISPKSREVLMKQLTDQSDAPITNAPADDSAREMNARAARREQRLTGATVGNPEVARIAALVIGSPEFQRQ
jgi:uncharacterized protein (DUF1800 family)